MTLSEKTFVPSSKCVSVCGGWGVGEEHSLVCSRRLYWAPVGIGGGGKWGEKVKQREMEGGHLWAPCGKSYRVTEHKKLICV